MLYQLQQSLLLHWLPEILGLKYTVLLYSAALYGTVHKNTTPRMHVTTYQNQKHDAVKVLHSVCQQIRKTQQWPQDWKKKFIPIPKKGKPPIKINKFLKKKRAMPKNVETTIRLPSFHTLARLCSKSFRLGFSGT